MSPNLQIEKLIQRDVRLLVQGHKESKWQNEDSKPGWVVPRSTSLTIMLTMLPFNTMTIIFLLPVQTNYRSKRTRSNGKLLNSLYAAPRCFGCTRQPFCFFFPPADFHNLILLSLPFWACPCLSICVAHPVVSKMMNEKREEGSICSLWTNCLMEENDSPTHYWIFMNFCLSNVTYTTVKGYII